MVGPALALEPPDQPVSGPGGRQASHAALSKELYGEGARSYWLFEPAEPQPLSAPVVVFCHGIGATDPAIYAAWIRHIVERGLIVIYPIYQDAMTSDTRELSSNAIAAVRAALAQLQGPGHVRPELEHLAVVGHSAGGQISANLAALAAASGLPVPGAVMCVEPGRSWPKGNRPMIALEDLSGIAPQTLLLAVAGADDQITGETDARRIIRESSRVKPEDKNLVIAHSDRRGAHWLKADHAAPEAPEPEADAPVAKRVWWSKFDFRRTPARVRYLDALDYYCFWKLFDGLCDAAFYDRNRAYALGATDEQRFMGLWSDGQPVRPLTVETGARVSGQD